MGASSLEIWRHASNVIQRASYGVNGKKQFELQKTRMTDMSKGEHGGSPNNEIMVDSSGHEGTIRQMHFSDWEDADFARALEIIAEWEATGELPPKPQDAREASPLEIAIDRAYAILMALERDDRIDALNDLAERLGVLEPDDDPEESQEVPA